VTLREEDAHVVTFVGLHSLCVLVNIKDVLLAPILSVPIVSQRSWEFHGMKPRLSPIGSVKSAWVRVFVLAALLVDLLVGLDI